MAPNRPESEYVAPLIFSMAIMTLYPAPCYIMRFCSLKESLPEVFIHNILLLGVLPSFFYPVLDPLGHALHYIAGVRRYIHFTGDLECLKRCYYLVPDAGK